MEIVVQRGTPPREIDVEKLADCQKPGYLNLKIKLKLISLYPQISRDLINDAIDHIDLVPFTTLKNSDQKLLLANIIKYQLMIRGIDADINTICNIF